MEFKLIADAAQAYSDTAVISFSVEPRIVLVEYRGPIKNEFVVKLIDQIDQLNDQFQPEKVILTLNSPGGDVTSVHFMKKNLETWREKGLVIETRGGTTCASAAAVMFALGEVGTRQTRDLTTLLFHNPRIMPSAAPLLQHHLSYMCNILEKSTEQMNQYLTSHLKKSLGLMGHAQTLKKRAQCLNDPTFLMECDHLSLYSAGCIFPIDEMKQEFEVWANWEIEDSDSANALIARWENTVKKLHDLDGKVDLRCAWGMLLIDKTDSLPTLCIKDFSNNASRPVCDPDAEVMQTQNPELAQQKFKN